MSIAVQFMIGVKPNQSYAEEVEAAIDAVSGKEFRTCGKPQTLKGWGFYYDHEKKKIMLLGFSPNGKPGHTKQEVKSVNILPPENYCSTIRVVVFGREYFDLNPEDSLATAECNLAIAKSMDIHGFWEREFQNRLCRYDSGE